MNKPFAMLVKETQSKLADVCNESGLSFVALDLIMQGIYSEIHSLAEKQTNEEEAIYTKMLAEESKKLDVTDDNTIKDNVISNK